MVAGDNLEELLVDNIINKDKHPQVAVRLLSLDRVQDHQHQLKLRRRGK